MVAVNRSAVSELVREAAGSLQTGRFENAEELLHRAVIAEPNHADANHLLAILEFQRNRNRIGFEYGRKAVRLRPTESKYHNTLGAAYANEKDFPRAIHHLWQAVAHSPGYLDALQNLVRVLYELGENEEAGQLVARAFRLKPESVELALLHCRALRDAERASDAIATLRQHLDRFGYQEALLCELGGLYLQNDDADLAAECFQQVLERRTESVLALNGFAQARFQSGRLEEAISSWKQSLKLKPNQPEVHRNLAVACTHLADTETAIHHFQEALRLSPAFAEAHLGLSLVKRFQASDPEIEQMKSLCASEQLPTENRAKIHFALGKAFEDSGACDEAFTTYAQGNALRKALSNYDVHQEERKVDSYMGYFTRNRFQSFGSRFGVDSPLPIFVVGMPRSGTTLVEQILSSHPGVFGAGELDYVEKVIQQLVRSTQPRATFPHVFDYADQVTAKRLAGEHISRLSKLSPEASRIVDKMPGNVMLLGPITLLWPNAKIIHCRRDPLDVCLSCFTRNFAHGHDFSWSLEDLGRQYRLYEQLTEHWRRVLPVPVFEIQYEELVRDHKDVIRRLIQFVDLDWNDSCLTHNAVKRRVKTNPVQVHQPIYTSSVGRWKRFETHLQPLIQSLGGYAGNGD